MVHNIKDFADFIIVDYDEPCLVFASLLAFQTKVPLILDRGKPKKYGMKKRYEGITDINKFKGKRCVVIKFDYDFQPKK